MQVINYQGQWNNITTYLSGESVSYNNSVYIALSKRFEDEIPLSHLGSRPFIVGYKEKWKGFNWRFKLVIDSFGEAFTHGLATINDLTVARHGSPQRLTALLAPSM